MTGRVKMIDVSDPTLPGGPLHDRQSFGDEIPLPEFPSFLDIAKKGVRMADRPKAIPGRRGMSFFQHPCDAQQDYVTYTSIPNPIPGTVQVSEGLDKALAAIRQERGDTPLPSPYLSTFYTVKSDV
jgi:hypothetical protein